MKKTKNNYKSQSFLKTQKDYNDFMKGFVDNPLFQNTGGFNPNVYFEEFSIYDKNAKSTATTITIL